MLSIEEFIARRKKEDKVNELNVEERNENMRVCVNYVFEYFNYYLNITEAEEKTVLKDEKSDKYRQYADLHGVIFNISKALKPEGYFYASFKYGDFEGERNGRYFINLTEESLNSLLDAFHELEIVAVTGDVRDGRENEKWLNVIIKKIIS